MLKKNRQTWKWIIYESVKQIKEKGPYGHCKFEHKPPSFTNGENDKYDTRCHNFI